MIDRTYGMVDDEQGGFRPGRECMNQVFVLRQLIGKERELNCMVYVSFMNPEKVYQAFMFVSNF